MANTTLTRTFGTPSSTKTGTFSFWLKNLSSSGGGIFNNYGDANNRAILYISNSQIDYYDAATGTSISGTPQYRDTNGWYHVVLRIDTTQSSANDRTRVYVNGALQEATYGHTYNLNENSYMFTAGTPFVIGRDNSSGGSGDHLNAVISHFHYCDGQSYAPTVFGSTDSTTGEWKINTSPSMTMGNQGFTILKDGNTITDQSANSNNFSLGGGTLTKTEDSPSNVFATWNPLQATTSASYDFSAGNTRMAVNDAAVFSLGATLAAKTGKYYMEMKWVQQGGNGSWGMIPINTNIKNRPRNAGVGWNQGDNAPWLLGSIVSGSWGGSIGTGDIIQLAMDLDNGAFYFGKNGTYLNSGNPTSGASKTGAVDFSGTTMFGEDITFAIGKGASGTDGWNANFGNGYFEQTAVSSAGTNASGNGIFEYDVPTGFTALSTKGLNT